jgi:putative restriction endonuclease
LIPREEFDAIIQAGLSVLPDPWEAATHVQEQEQEYPARPIIERLQLRKFRDVAFRRHVRNAYDNTCAITGLRLINGGGRPEVQAAHIWPVEHDGPDTVRNGLALTGTAHWLFDRGLISVDDDYRVLLSSNGLPDGVTSLISPDRQLRLPAEPAQHPHPRFLRWHRENRFKG